MEVQVFKLKDLENVFRRNTKSFRRTADSFFNDSISESSSLLRSIEGVIMPLKKIMVSSGINLMGLLLRIGDVYGDVYW